jgi:importin-7
MNIWDLMFVYWWLQCETYMRLVRENLAQEEVEAQQTDTESILSDADDDKTYAAMSVAKTLSTVCCFLQFLPLPLALNIQ